MITLLSLRSSLRPEIVAEHARKDVQPRRHRLYVKRGVLVLEEDLKALENPLKSRNFWVYMISAVAADQQMDLLVHRVLITEHSKDLLEAAVIHEFGIIDTALATKEPERLADIISREWLAGSLRGRRPFIARNRADGSVTVGEIED
jgi:hypothetical protein